MDDPRPGASPHPGLLAALRSLAASAVDLLRTRGELLATEIEEERARLVRLLLLSVIAAFFLAIGVVTLTIFIILLASNRGYGLQAAGLLTAVYLVAGIAAAYGVRQLARARSKLFSASLAELRKDRDQLIS